MARSHHEPDSMDLSSIELSGLEDQGYDNNRSQPLCRSLLGYTAFVARTDEDNDLSSLDNSIGLAKYYSYDITPFSTETDRSVVKRIKWETVSIFNPNFKNYKKTGLVIVQGSGAQG
ncbi:hypothetical protein EDB80DRAFT_689465 [Ilyonectria destructans]|nr:hypothetical protein EDB80DRAFT_689465 [Ilyonectria destructans]